MKTRVENYKRTITKRVFVGAGIWFVLIGLIFVVGIVGFLLSISFLGISDCGASAQAWLDADGDGTRDVSEEPLAGVCIWASHDSPKMETDVFGNPVCQNSWALTDSEGRWNEMYACGSPVYLSAIAPAGYKPSTHPVIKYENSARFGFTKIDTDVSQEFPSIEEYYDSYRREAESILLIKRIFSILGVCLFTVLTVWLSLYLARKFVPDIN